MNHKLFPKLGNNLGGYLDWGGSRVGKLAVSFLSIEFEDLRISIHSNTRMNKLFGLLTRRFRAWSIID